VSSSSARIDRGESDRLGSTDPALLRMLADPASYGGVPVVVHETHASWVFVAGERAYKIKKPAWALGRGLLVGVAIVVLGGIYPAWRVTRMTPLKALSGT
jgi:hypothetical protein